MDITRREFMKGLTAMGLTAGFADIAYAQSNITKEFLKKLDKHKELFYRGPDIGEDRSDFSAYVANSCKTEDGREIYLTVQYPVETKVTIQGGRLYFFAPKPIKLKKGAPLVLRAHDSTQALPVLRYLGDTTLDGQVDRFIQTVGIDELSLVDVNRLSKKSKASLQKEYESGLDILTQKIDERVAAYHAEKTAP